MARAQIARAQAKLADAQAGIAAAKAASGAGMLLASSLVEVAKADERQAKIDLERARDDLERALADQRKANTRAGAASRGLQQALQVELGLRSPGSLPPLTPLPPFATSGALGTSFLNGENLFSAASAYFNLAGGALAPAARDLTRAKADLAQGRRKVRGYPKYDPDQDPDVDKSVTDRKRAAINKWRRARPRSRASNASLGSGPASGCSVCQLTSSPTRAI